MGARCPDTGEPYNSVVPNCKGEPQMLRSIQVPLREFMDALFHEGDLVLIQLGIRLRFVSECHMKVVIFWWEPPGTDYPHAGVVLMRIKQEIMSL